MTTTSLDSLTKELRVFASERDWQQFHSPKNLSMALAGEAGELLEHFQWLTEQQSQNLDPEQLSAVSRELADILLYLLMLADKLEIDLLDIAQDKIHENAQKYPVEQSRGSAKKYTQLDPKS